MSRRPNQKLITLSTNPLNHAEVNLAIPPILGNRELRLMSS